jgi:two-component system OmpR family sensor kinase
MLAGMKAANRQRSGLRSQQQSRGLPSLRLWLQSTSVLAVLAGFSLLLLLNQLVSGWQRNKAHLDLVLQLTHTRPQHSGRLLPGLQVQMLAGWVEQRPRLERSDGQSWLVSITPLPPGPGGLQSLKLSQNVSNSVQREWLSFLLFVAMAGSFALLTAGLLRLVLQRGLVQPLDELCQQLDALQAPPAPLVVLAEENQPSELRPIVAAFNAMQERLAGSWEQQRSFVDGVAHELRTPLTLILGHAQSLQRQPVVEAHPDVGSALQLIASEAHRMGLLVSDLLDLARRDAGRLTLQPVSLDPEEALLTCYERLVASSGGRLRLGDGGIGVPLPTVMADADRLQQCLAALIDNALRYSPDPKPVQLSAEQGATGLVLHVRDHGPGVADDERERIFERFVRGTAAEGTRGSGIGLSIVRLLIEAMGGSVQVEPAPGGGADFQLRLPRA